MKTAITLFTAVLALSGCSLESLRPSAPAATDTTTHDNQSTVATLPPIVTPGLPTDPRVYRVDWGNTGVGGAAQRVPDFIHVLGFAGAGTPHPGRLHGQGIALHQDRVPTRARTGGDAGRKRSGPGEDDAIDPVMRKYCQDPDSLTPSEQERFRALGGVKAIPLSLAKHCRFNK